LCLINEYDVLFSLSELGTYERSSDEVDIYETSTERLWQYTRTYGTQPITGPLITVAT